MPETVKNLLTLLQERFEKSEFGLKYIGQQSLYKEDPRPLNMKCGAPTPEAKWCIHFHEGGTYSCWSETAEGCLRQALEMAEAVPVEPTPFFEPPGRETLS